MDEEILYEANPSMFRNKPVMFILCVLLSVVVVGLVILIVWYVQTLATELQVTNKRTILRKGLLSKYTSEVWHDNVRNVQIRQSFFQRIMNVGWIGISSAGQSGLEIAIAGIPDPEEAKEIIDRHRIMES
ncbi:Bacterial membrane flanked domain protein [Maioricimonas rarisocia]|uniref:Bacterial membrane flanked domain protein n=1 Tax=Maioricimonas rarisocia TaxID=2528026 RepID=A0A517Z3L5_9PLAN|nr:PH domain-containing protein [Maioricimonas rarisocia]QDU37084.1 Bacterial membrane flanked domain protein [Maioricimonas rarisocia]